MHGVLLAVWCLSVLGCAEVDNPYRRYPEPQYETFVSTIQPLVAEHCGFLGCHGAPDRALTLYAVDYYRAPPSFPGTPIDERRLSEAELAWNYDALRMRLLGESSAEDSRLLLKCLDPAEGGIAHAGDAVVFESVQDPGYMALRDWIAGGLAP